MPKVYITEIERKNETVRCIIDEYIGKRRLYNKAKLSRHINMVKQKFYRRYENPEMFTLGEMRILFKSLQFSDEDILKFVKS